MVTSSRNESGLIAISFVTPDGTVLYDAGVSDKPASGSRLAITDPSMDTWIEEPSSQPELGGINRSRYVNGREAWLSSNPAMMPSAVSAEQAAVFAQTFGPVLDACLRDGLRRPTD